MLEPDASQPGAPARDLAEANARLLEMARRLAAHEMLLERLPAGVTFIDKDFIFRMVNPALARYYGRPVPEVIGRSVYEILPNFTPAFQAIYQHVRDTLEPIEVLGQPGSIDMHDPDRRLYWDAKIMPHIDEQGDFAGWVVVILEVGARVRAELERERTARELARQRDFLGKLVANAPMAIAYFDQDLIYRISNPTHAAILGLTPEQIIGRHLFDVLPGAEQDLEQHVRAVLKTGEAFHGRTFPVRFRQPDGTERQTYWDFSHISMPSADGPGVLSVALEVSERVAREAEQQRLRSEHDALQRSRIHDLEQANVHKEQFLGILSHELRTPLNAVLGFGSILEDGVAGDLSPDQMGYLHKIIDAAEGMLALVSDLLDMSRVQAGQFSLMVEPVAPGPLVQHAVARLVESALVQHRVVNEVAQDLPEVRADALRMVQVLDNLLNNAAKYSPPGGEIRVLARLEGDYLRIEVADQGPGVAPADRQRIFEPFTQLDMSNTRTRGGVGLGLSIVQALVTAHGGRVGVEGEPGQGSVFWFTMPLFNARFAGS